MSDRAIEAIVHSVQETVLRNNRRYGGSHAVAGEIMRLLYPNGIEPDQYTDSLGIVRVLDKLGRLAHGGTTGVDEWLDIAGYGVLGVLRRHMTHDEFISGADEAIEELQKVSENLRAVTAATCAALDLDTAAIAAEADEIIRKGRADR